MRYFNPRLCHMYNPFERFTIVTKFARALLRKEALLLPLKAVKATHTQYLKLKKLVHSAWTARAKLLWINHSARLKGSLSSAFKRRLPN